MRRSHRIGRETLAAVVRVFEDSIREFTVASTGSACFSYFTSADMARRLREMMSKQELMLNEEET